MFFLPLLLTVDKKIEYDKFVLTIKDESFYDSFPVSPMVSGFSILSQLKKTV